MLRRQANEHVDPLGPAQTIASRHLPKSTAGALGAAGARGVENEERVGRGATGQIGGGAGRRIRGVLLPLCVSSGSNVGGRVLRRLDPKTMCFLDLAFGAPRRRIPSPSAPCAGSGRGGGGRGRLWLWLRHRPAPTYTHCRQQAPPWPRSALRVQALVSGSRAPLPSPVRESAWTSATACGRANHRLDQ
jgi:hypothetical protein